MQDSAAHSPKPRANEPPTLRVTVLCGGPSAERAVSLESGRAVADALRSRGHAVTVADIGPDQTEALDVPVDVIFPALHGTFGEDGTVQRMLEERGIRFVGSGSRASAVAMDKVATKQVAVEQAVSTPAFEVWDRARLEAGGTPGLSLPVVVKPVDQGSSVATRVVHETGALLPAVQVAIEQFGRALIEQYIKGEELTVGLVGERNLPPICVRPKRGFYDYIAKYEDNATEYLFDAEYAPAVLEQAQQLSRRMFESLGCRHLARVDWMIDAQGQLWFLEVNTLPGFTSHSLVPKAAAHVGIAFDELVEELVYMAYREPA